MNPAYSNSDGMTFCPVAVSIASTSKQTMSLQWHCMLCWVQWTLFIPCVRHFNIVFLTEWIFSSKDISLHSTTFHYPFGRGWLHRGNMWVPFTWPLATPSPNQTPSYFSGAIRVAFLAFLHPINVYIGLLKKNSNISRCPLPTYPAGSIDIKCWTTLETTKPSSWPRRHIVSRPGWHQVI